MVDFRAQEAVGILMGISAAALKPSRILSHGDNIYWNGVGKDDRDYRMAETFEKMYGAPSLENVPWLNVAGNHDIGGSAFICGDSDTTFRKCTSTAEMLKYLDAKFDLQAGYVSPRGDRYGASRDVLNWSSRWIMKGHYYVHRVTKNGVTVDIFNLDTNEATTHGAQQVCCQCFGYGGSDDECDNISPGSPLCAGGNVDMYKVRKPSLLSEEMTMAPGVHGSNPVALDVQLLGATPDVCMLEETDEAVSRRKLTRLVFSLGVLAFVGGGIAAAVVLAQPSVESSTLTDANVNGIHNSTNVSSLSNASDLVLVQDNDTPTIAPSNATNPAPSTPTVVPWTTLTPTEPATTVGTAPPTTNPPTQVTTTATPTTSAATVAPIQTGLGRILTKDIFLAAFPKANPLYKYESLVTMAATKYPEFANTGDEVADRREVAAFLGHVSLESGDLRFVEELNKSSMCQASAEFPCAAGKQYYGRGPMQLSWNYNYKTFGTAAGVDLVANPDLVASDRDLLWWSALWFSNEDKWNGNIHKAIRRPGGFAYVTYMINGGLECGVNPPNRDSEKSRIASYVKFCNVFGVDPGDNLSCQTGAFPPTSLWTDDAKHP
ncbi:hypothetical protein DYB32_006690 [Aphanomyces invadans]|uniref:Glycoside hydrolase family 19 catalytic domain-containing protein n=1 Tax=Aphanomyces invadans TaxID=157072 RepID=A0A3R6VJ58_9STRA|nr:hypothetical protein DYB32_006690 [Aphanomyces invadans]